MSPESLGTRNELAHRRRFFLGGGEGFGDGIPKQRLELVFVGIQSYA